MAKPLADCRIRIEFTHKKQTHNIGLFHNPVSRKIEMRMLGTSQEVTPSELGQRLGKWIGEGIK